MSPVDPWEKAAECARAIQGTIDPHRRAVLTNLQKLWIALANERDFLTDEQVADEAEKIGRLQVGANAPGTRVTQARVAP